MMDIVGRIRARLPGVRVVGATAISALGSSNAAHGAPEEDVKRKALNDFIRQSRLFDGVIDFDKVTLDPQRHAAGNRPGKHDGRSRRQAASQSGWLSCDGKCGRSQTADAEIGGARSAGETLGRAPPAADMRRVGALALLAGISLVAAGTAGSQPTARAIPVTTGEALTQAIHQAAAGGRITLAPPNHPTRPLPATTPPPTPNPTPT